MPAVAIVGASRDRTKYGNKAVRAYRTQGWTVVPVHPSERAIEGLPTARSLADMAQAVERVVFYVPPEIGLHLLDDVAALGAGVELWISPGAESEALLARADALGLSPIQACAIVDVGESPARYGP